ncbi:glycosyltransferase family 1 protein [Bifidobacterium reuteri]|uniref:Glycosyltransferase family 1 protein n=2 Tax=Bifidobacterium reuteri TaxID=983706 RepID=A0A5J5E7C8_9BIFI|nr:glycosyltransferase family 1 protein [Bifidobacterium reuteri]
MDTHPPIRILHWGMTYGLGGLETFLMNVYRHIDRSQVQFDFLQDHNEPKLAFEDEITELGGNVYRVMYSQRESLFKAHTCIPQFLNEHEHEFAGIHVNANFPYAFPLRYARKAGISMRIIHSHNCIPDSYWKNDNTIRKIMRDMTIQSAKRDIATLPTQYFACSSLAARYMFPPKQPYTLVRNGIDTNRFQFNEETRARLRKQLNIASSTTVIGFCGTLREQKNPLFLLDVFAAYHVINPDSMLLIVGDGELRSSVKQHASELHIGDSVTITGMRKDTADLYQAMDAFVLPSLFEGLGIVYIEAQCAGLPTLASSHVVPEEISVTDRLHFIGLEESAQEWAATLSTAIQSAKSSSISRATYATQVRSAGYDMEDVALMLQDYYLEHSQS